MNPTNPSESEQSSGCDQSITSSNSAYLSEPVEVVTVNTETECNNGNSDTSDLNITQATTVISEDSSLVTNEEPQILISPDMRLVSGNACLENNVENMNKLKVITSNMACNVKTEFQSEQQSMDNTSTTNVTILPSASNNEKKGKSRRRRKGITRVGKRGKYCEFPVWRQKLLNEMNKAKMELLKDNGCKSPGTPKRRLPTNTDAGEQNLVVTQIDREIYFVTNRDVRENEELLFWYPEYYGARLGVSQNPQLLMSKACPVSACKVRFKCTDYMVRHLSLVHHEGTREHLGKTGYYCAVCAQADVRSTNKKCFHATYDKLIQHILSDKSHTPNSCDGCGRMIAPDPELMFMHADCQALIEQKLLIEREKALKKMQRKKLVNSVASCNVNQGCDTEMNGALDQGVEMENPESQRTKKVTVTDPIIPPVENSIEPSVSETDVKKKSSKSVNQKPCRFCGKMISAKNQYRHEKYIHLGKPHPRPTTKQLCGICGIYVLSVRKHERNIHLGIKKIQKACQICGKVISAQQLSRHRRIHNSGTESKSNYPCEYCGKIFNRPDNLKTHIRRHTGDMPFVCQHCGKGHTTKQWRDNHQKTCAQSPNPLPHNDIIIRPKRKAAKRHQDAMSYATYESQLATEHREIDNDMSVSQNMEITLGSTSGVAPYYCGM